VGSTSAEMKNLTLQEVLGLKAALRLTGSVTLADDRPLGAMVSPEGGDITVPPRHIAWE
jgi:hypothetical protein